MIYFNFSKRKFLQVSGELQSAYLNRAGHGAETESVN